MRRHEKIDDCAAFWKLFLPADVLVLDVADRFSIQDIGLLGLHDDLLYAVEMSSSFLHVHPCFGIYCDALCITTVGLAGK